MAAIDVQGLARGIHEVLILAVLRGDPKHGYQIALDVEEETGGAFGFQHGTLYPILHRLEGEGLMEGRWDRSGGRRRKVYALTDGGRQHLAAEGGRVLEAFEVLRDLLGGGR